MKKTYDILILGASYGSLLGTKLLLAGHNVKLVCLPAEADAINVNGTRVRMPVKGREGLVEVDSRKLPGHLSADAPGAVNPADYELVAAIAREQVPCMSIMNMPPLPYIARIPGVLSIRAIPGPDVKTA